MPDFDLPPELIAQHPLPERDASRLMVVSRATGRIDHRSFRELPELLRAGDLLVVNDAKVIPARLIGKKAGTGGRVELLLVRPASDAEWFCMGQASKGLKPGAKLAFGGGLTAEILEARGGGEVRVRFDPPEALMQAGRMPLPPYITREPTQADAERYQTVYARSAGSVAAPTAGLHFTPRLFDELEARGVRRAEITLDVGPGTFLPIRDGDLDRHVMHSERFVVPPETAAAIAQTRQRGGRVVAVGTTVVRTLESATDEAGGVRPGPGETALFIRPGFRFRQVDVLITNFHLPESTLIVLVSAFLGEERTRAAYRTAVEQRYRFFSYGDAMLIE